VPDPAGRARVFLLSWPIASRGAALMRAVRAKAQCTRMETSST
jgi:hypothetical protein